MNMSILRKSSQIISNHVMYGHAKTWTCQSLAKDVCKKQMPRCKFQSEMSVKAFLRKKTKQMHPEVGVYLQMEDWNDDDAHPNYVEMSTRRTLRFILQVLNYVCIYMVLIVLDIFFISPNSRPLPTFLPFPHGTHRRIQASRPCTTGAISETPGGGPATPISCRARSAPRCKSSVHADLHEQPCGPPAAAGEAGSGWAEVFGWREVTFLNVSPGH